MNRISLTTALLLLFSVVISAQTFVEFDRIAWGSIADGTLTGVSAMGNAWDATANENCDGTGTWGPSGGQFVIEDWEGTCGCDCVAGAATPLCGENNNTILIPAAIVAGYCQVRVSFSVTALGGVACGQMNDKDRNDFVQGCVTSTLGADWAGTDGMIISFTTSSGNTDQVKICGDQGVGTVTSTFDVDAFDAVGIIINAGTQEEGESYVIGDIIFEGVEREIITLNTTCTSCDGGNIICENSGLPIRLQTIANSGTSTFAWTGPNGFSSTQAQPEIPTYTTAASGDYTVTVTESSTCTISETINITVLSANDATCRPQAVFSNLFAEQCSDAVLPSQDENGVTGVWTPTDTLASFPDQTVFFTFTPDDAGISPFQIELEIADINSLEEFGSQPNDLPVFCSQSTQTFDLIELFDFNLNVLLAVNGDGNLFNFINSGDFMNDFESQFRNYSFFGQAAGTREFFIEGISTCGSRQQGFTLRVIDMADPIRIDTSLCPGDTFSVAGIKLFGGIGDTVLVDGGACDTILVASVGLNQPGRMRSGVFFPGSQRSFACLKLVYFYDTIVSGQRGVLIEGDIGEEPPLGPNYDTIFTQSVTNYTLPFSAGNGCDSIVNFGFSIPTSSVLSREVTICEDESVPVVINGTTYTVDAGANRDRVYLNYDGPCTALILTADVLPVDRDTITSLNTRIFKEGQDTTIRGILFNQDNPTQLIPIPNGSPNNCNAFTFVDLQFAAAQFDTINERICPGDGVPVGDTVFTDNTTNYNYLFPVLAGNGGDSIAVVTVELLLPVAQSVDTTICREDDFIFLGETFDSSRTTGFINLRSPSLGCDSIIYNVNVSFFSAPDIVRDTTFCEGGSVFYAEYNIMLDESNLSDQTTITTPDGCDQRVFVNATVLRPVTFTFDTTICQGDSYVFGSLTLTESGQSAQVLTAGNGCDSTVIVTLTVLPNSFFAFDTSACAGSGYSFGSEFLATSGVYVDTLVAGNGCDSIVEVTLTINDPIEIDSMMTICAGESFEFNGIAYDTDTVISVPGVTPEGCSEILVFTLDVLEPIITVSPIVAPRCADGTTVTVGTNTYDASGIYRDTFPTSMGCDSVVVTELILPDSIITRIDSTICGGDFITINGQRVENQGITDVLFFANNGCDSIVRINLSLIAPYSETIDLILCPGDDFSRFNDRFSNPMDTLTRFVTRTYRSRPQDGCDTTITVNFTVVGIGQPTINADICSGDSIVLGTQAFKESFVGNISYVDTFGCNRNVVLNLNVFEDLGEDLGEQVLCPGEGFVVGDSTYTEIGPHVAILPTVRPFTGAICDSTVFFSISFAPILLSDTQEASICQGESYLFGGNQLMIAGTYFDTLTAMSTMCDSIVELNLTVIAPVTDTIRDVILCPGDQFAAFNGEFIINTGNGTTSTSGTQTFTSQTGCDTTVVVFFTNVRGTSTPLDITICEGDTYAIGGETYDMPGSYSIALPHPTFACDSLVELTLTVITDLSEDLGVIAICEGESFRVGGIDYAIADDYSVMLPSTRFNSDGVACDSIVTFSLQVNPIVTQVLTETICAGASFLVGDMAYTTAGTYSDTLTTEAGCDSIVNLTLSIITPEVVTIDTSICFGETINIGGQTLDRTQMTDIIIPSSEGCDSIIYNVDLLVNNQINTVNNFEICPGESVMVGSSVYDQPGMYEDILTASTGCDSTIRTNITLRPIPETNITDEACTGSTYTFGGVEISVAGTYRDTVRRDGCDSIVILALVFVDQKETQIDEIICDGESFTFAGNVLTESGMYTDILQSSIGCDSVITLDLTVTTPLQVDTETVIGACEGVSNGSFVISDIPGSTGPYSISGLPGISDAATLPITVTGLPAQTYNYTITDANGCSATGTAIITNDRSNAISINSVTVNPAGVFDLFVDFDGTATSVIWDNVPGLSCYDCSNPQATITEPTTFTVTVIDAEGCTSVASITLRVDGVGNIYIPSVFNPDSEDGNDRFFIQGEDNDVFYDIWIYDRWGNLVYNVNGAQINERESGWDGRWGIRELNPGVYVFTTRIFKANGIEEKMNGDITIVR